MLRRSVFFFLCALCIVPAALGVTAPKQKNPPPPPSGEECGYPDDILQFEHDLDTNDRPEDRSALVTTLRCLRNHQIASFDSNSPDAVRAKRIERLEAFAQHDLARLTERAALFDKLVANGPSPGSAAERENVRKCLDLLASTVHLNADAKPVLVENLFTTMRADRKTKEQATAAQTAEDTARDDCQDLEAVQGLSDFKGIQRCVEVLSLEIRKAKAANDHKTTKELETLLENVQDVGATLLPGRKKAADELADKLAASKDDNEKKDLLKQQKDLKAEIDTLNEIAAEPSARRACINADTPAHLDTVAGLKRCVEAVALARELVVARRPDLVEPRRSEAEVAELHLQMARFDDETDTPLLPIAVSVCDVAPSKFNIHDHPAVARCRDRLRDELKLCDRDRTLRLIQCDQDKARLAFLEQQGVRIEARGATLAERNEAELAKLVRDHDGLKDPEKTANEARQKTLNDELDVLMPIAIAPHAARLCTTDRFSHQKITGARYVQRCIAALRLDLQDALSAGKSRREIRDHELRLARFEEAGRRIVRVSLDQVTSLDAQIADSTKPQAQRDLLKKDRDAANAEAEALRGSVLFPSDNEQTEFADYEQWFSRISMGYQYAKISNAFSKGFPRIGAMVGYHYPREGVPDDSSNWGLHYGVYQIFRVYLTQSAEAGTTDLFKPKAATTTSARKIRAEDDGETTAASEASPNPPITQAVDFETELFAPVWRNDFQIENPRLRSRLGPILSVGGRKTDTDAFTHFRAYLGLRAARSPDVYWDLLVGKTSGLHSRRIEYRGQYMLPKTFTGNMRIAVGAVGNFGIDKRRHGTCNEPDSSCRLDESDVISFFASFEVAADKVTKFFGGK